MTWISPLFGRYQKILKIIFSNLAHIIVGEHSKSINNMQTLSWRGLHYSSLFYPFSIEPLYWSKSASQTENISPHSTTQFPLCIGLQVRNVEFWFDVFICITSAESLSEFGNIVAESQRVTKSIGRKFCIITVFSFREIILSRENPMSRYNTKLTNRQGTHIKQVSKYHQVSAMFVQLCRNRYFRWAERVNLSCGPVFSSCLPCSTYTLVSITLRMGKASFTKSSIVVMSGI